jgi:hypothetical protein
MSKPELAIKTLVMIAILILVLLFGYHMNHLVTWGFTFSHMIGYFLGFVIMRVLYVLGASFNFL